jgi:HEPN domain-containing protein
MTDGSESSAWPSTLDVSEYVRWRETAESNLASARREAAAGAHHVAVFLAEQAAQCATKAVLHGVGATAKAYGHGLLALADAVAEEVDAALPDTVVEAMQRLAQAYMPSRYPDALPDGSPVNHYGASHSTQAVADAVAVMDFTHRTWQALRKVEQQNLGPQPGGTAG